MYTCLLLPHIKGFTHRPHTAPSLRLLYGSPALSLADVWLGDVSSSSLRYPSWVGPVGTCVCDVHWQILSVCCFFFLCVWNRVGFQVSWQTCRRPAAIINPTARRNEHSWRDRSLAHKGFDPFYFNFLGDILMFLCSHLTWGMVWDASMLFSQAWSAWTANCLDRLDNQFNLINNVPLCCIIQYCIVFSVQSL